MNSQRLIEDIQELVSEAAVEIANLDSPENIVYRRLRAMQNRLQLAAVGDGQRKFMPSEAHPDFLASGRSQQIG